MTKSQSQNSSDSSDSSGRSDPSGRSDLSEPTTIDLVPLPGSERRGVGGRQPAATPLQPSASADATLVLRRSTPLDSEAVVGAAPGQALSASDFAASYG